MHSDGLFDLDADLRGWTLAELYGAFDLIDDLVGPSAMRIAMEIDRRARMLRRRRARSASLR